MGELARQYTESTLKRLFALSGNFCAIPGCPTGYLIYEDSTNLAQICHIEAASPKGQRYNLAMTDEERRAFENLILLCSNCHIKTNNEKVYTVEVLKTIKRDHEGRFLNFQDDSLFQIFAAKYAYDIIYNEHKDWGILEEIIKHVNNVSPSLNPTTEEISHSGKFLSLIEKVQKNFPIKPNRNAFEKSFLSTYSKKETAEKFLENLSEENPVQVVELHDFISSKYRELKVSDHAEIKIENITIIDKLANMILPEPKQSSPGYHSTAKALVLLSFELCHIGERTANEQLSFPGLFD
jgi:hypothetical protein